MEKKFKILDWDTAFYGVCVAEIEKNILNGHQGVNNLEIIHENNIDLAYYSSNMPLSREFDNNNYYHITLVVRRIPLIKKAQILYKIHEKIEFYKEEYPELELIELAQLAGREGRFSKDPRITKNKCDELFKHWIINSVNGKMADEILVYRESSKIVGFATIKIDNGIGYTPLLAVHPDYEGKGISFALMRAIETRLIVNNCEKVMGGTQDMNIKALKVYERYGLIPQEPEYVYHLWKK
jgi:dTDP-4-amino-4,6-dideoxy-D-galactose acyltransferase